MTVAGRRRPESTDQQLDGEHAKHDYLAAEDAQLMLADQRYCSVEGPHGWVSGCRPPFSRTSSLTAADCHHILVFLMPYLLFGVVPVDAYNVIVSLCDAIGQFLGQEITTARFGQMKADLQSALKRFHLFFPATEHRINLHLFSHLPDLVEVWGVTIATNMFPFER